MRICELDLAYAYVYAFHKLRECIFLGHGKATIVVHVSHHNNSTPVVYTRSPTRFPTVLLPLSTPLSSFPQPPFEAVPSTRGGSGGGKRRGVGKMRGGPDGEGTREVGGEQGNYPLQGKNHLRGEGIGTGTGRSRRAASGDGWFSSFSAP